MDRRRFLLGIGGVTISTNLAGCSSDNTTETEPPNDETETELSDDEIGPRGPEQAVEHYNNAIELIEKNADEFREARQQMILDHERIDFDSTVIASRTSEIRTQLDRAEEEDDGSLSDEIKTLRRIASYQDTLAEVNDEYLKLTRLINTGLDEYFAGQHQSSIEVLEDARSQIEPTRSALETVTTELEEIQSVAEQAEMSDELIQESMLTTEENAETRVELTIVSDLVPARIEEVEGDLLFDQGFNEFENEDYTAARSDFSNAESHFITAKTRLESIDVEETTAYIQSIINDTESLICEYGFSVGAANDFQKAATAMQNGNFEQAEQHWENGSTNISRIDTC